MPHPGWKIPPRNNIVGAKYTKKFNKEEGLTIDYKLHKQIIVESNKIIADIIVKGEDGFRIPKGMGAWVVSKYKSTNYTTDYGNTRKLGKWIKFLNLHTYGFQFKLKWFKIDVTHLAYQGVYKFKGARSLTRAIGAMAKKTNGKNYFEWQYHDFKKASKLEHYLIKKDKNTEYGNHLL
jgi:hypothetical protein